MIDDVTALKESSKVKLTPLVASISAALTRATGNGQRAISGG